MSRRTKFQKVLLKCLTESAQEPVERRFLDTYCRVITIGQGNEFKHEFLKTKNDSAHCSAGTFSEVEMRAGN